jgi:hypothetical protein
MKRVIAKHSKEVEIKNSKKFKLIMEEKKFRLFIIKAQLTKNDEAKNLYKKCTNNK